MLILIGKIILFIIAGVMMGQGMLLGKSDRKVTRTEEAIILAGNLIAGVMLFSTGFLIIVLIALLK